MNPGPQPQPHQPTPTQQTRSLITACPTLRSQYLRRPPTSFFLCPHDIVSRPCCDVFHAAPKTRATYNRPMSMSNSTQVLETDRIVGFNLFRPWPVLGPLDDASCSQLNHFKHTRCRLGTSPKWLDVRLFGFDREELPWLPSGKATA